MMSNENSDVRVTNAYVMLTHMDNDKHAREMRGRDD